MGEKQPPYTSAWSGSYPDVQDLPKGMRRVLQNALTADRDDPARFLVAMGRLIRFCDIGTPARGRARRAAAAVLAEPRGAEKCLKLLEAISRSFSKAFRAVRYRERHVWEEESSPAMAIILARDDLESLWQAVRHGVPLPDLLEPEAFRALRNLRTALDDHIQTVEALHDGALDGYMEHDLQKCPADHDHEFLRLLVPVEPVRWWLAIFQLNLLWPPLSR
jgi:hypothetical protein